MSYEEEAGVEKGSKGGKPTLPSSMTLAKAIEFGEY